MLIVQRGALRGRKWYVFQLHRVGRRPYKFEIRCLQAQAAGPATVWVEGYNNLYPAVTDWTDIMSSPVSHRLPPSKWWTAPEKSEEDEECEVPF